MLQQSEQVDRTVLFKIIFHSVSNFIFYIKQRQTLLNQCLSLFEVLQNLHLGTLFRFILHKSLMKIETLLQQ